MAATTPRGKSTADRAEAIDRSRLLADEILVPRTTRAYAIPYYTRDAGETEYLISNPYSTPLHATLAIFGRDCKVAKKLDLELGPHCTQSVLLRAIVPNNAGHSILQSSAEPIIHLLYYRENMTLVGCAQAGRDNLFSWLPAERSRTYGLGYRASAQGGDRLSGAVFVSNPNNVVLTGEIVFYDQRCELATRKRFRVLPGCTMEFPFPANRFGHALVTVSKQAVINVLHSSASARGIAGAELIGEADRVTVPTTPPPTPRSKILFDDTHACRPGFVGDWTQYEAALVAAGYTVTHYTLPTVTLVELKKHDVFVVAAARAVYTAAEKQAISDFVNQGGGLLIVQDFGNAPWSVPTRDILNLFGTTDDNNFMQDPTNCFTPGQTDDVVFDYQRNFHPHPIVNGWKSFHVDAATSLSGGAGWATVVETDDDSTPVRRPAVVARAVGSGRIVAFGDSNTWANHLIGNLENRVFGVRCAEWLLFRI
jgi:hypothetical protein